MNSNARLGRAVGAALAAGFVLELVSNFQLQGALLGGAGFLANAASQPVKVGLVIVMGLVAGVLAVGVAATLAGRYAKSFPSLAWTYFALTLVALAATLVELSTFVAMRTLSEAYAAAGADAGSRFEVTLALVRGLRNGLHFSTKAFEGMNVLMFYALLYRARAVPRAIAVFGLGASVLQMAGVGPALFGQPVIYMLLAPLALAYAATFLWLLTKGLPPAAQTAE